MIKCCIKCEDERHIGCHTTCEKYKEEKQKHEEQKAIISKQRREYGEFQEYQKSKYQRLTVTK